jgi:hypothetical protein
MENVTTGRQPGSRSNEIKPVKFTSTKHINAKYPAYGKVLADRQRWNNKPMFVFVCLGGSAFPDAKKLNLDRDNAAMVLTPEQDPKTLIWPVKDCPVIIEWDGSASSALIIDLVKCLLRAFAISVTVWPTWIDYSTPLFYFDIATQKFIQDRESIKTYCPKQVKV